ncbi:hypothetical protein RHSIM_Rhsim06G0001900 [Rhododendron simsii]|uniref:BZIP domain-containing protein n=1 Tax=Rhododendron simsii TaxID=118357 RepID=A0A834GY42_RHOSS|nr:hypothetical protein RHSIM_Rhsim06G0001900 [Rhododendron simsii]
MGDSGVTDNEVAGQYDWILDGIPDDLSLFFDDIPLSDVTNSSPDSLPLTIDDIDQILLGDNDNEESRRDTVVAEQQLDIFSDYLLDSPVESDRSAEIVDLTDGGKNANSPSSSSAEEHHDVILPQDDSGDGGDPTNKKRQRQLRNRDAAVRSRERKKMYVRDLEMKTKYLEGECRRLGMLLQCCCAENQALRLSLQNAKAFDASMTKQESAVLLLEEKLCRNSCPLNPKALVEFFAGEATEIESLLLGSLLWFLGIVCLLIQPGLLQFDLETVQVGSVDKKNQGSLAVRKPGSKVFLLNLFRSFMVSKRCKASRSRMKPSFLSIEVLV